MARIDGHHRRADPEAGHGGADQPGEGNRVVVEEQMMRVAQTQMEYAEATGLYKKVFSLWRTALGASQA